MANVDAPGVYIENVPSLSPAIQGVGTSTALFVAPCPGASFPLDTAKAVTNPTEFLQHFGSERPEARHLVNAGIGFFMNGGQRLYVVAVNDAGGVPGDPKKRTGLWATRGIDEIAVVAAPGVTEPAVQTALLNYCEEMGDRFAILDPPETVDDLDRLTKAPIVRPTGDEAPKPDKPGAEAGGFKLASDQGFGALYFPWIVVLDQESRKVVRCPPSGHIAGLYARTDARRGVHKAPANEVLSGALDVSYNAAQAELGMLNRNGVNVIRSFPKRGVRVWGARTLADPASDWRYVNVKRFLLFVEGSLKEGLMSAVFEPNDLILRERLRMQISSFLVTTWRDGALVGATPEEAFFVKCDAENNPPDVVEKGQIRVDVGLAVSRPAEFVIVRLSQWNGAVDQAQAG